MVLWPIKVRLRSVHLAGDEGLHYPCVISLWPRLRHPLVLATFEQLVLDIAAGISIAPNLSCTAGRTLSSRAPCMIRNGTFVIVSWRSRISGLLS
jgi:hypothetical protein